LPETLGPERPAHVFDSFPFPVRLHA
jgi:hypothetical protein